ncbi:MAG: hypothetical protein R2725_15635 [Solirubrobacterales bacterium]
MIARAGIRGVGLALASVGLLAAVVAPAAGEPAVSGEFPVPGIASNNKLVAGPEGNMWLTVNEGGKDVAEVTPDGTVTEYDLDAVTASGIAVGPENRIWITRNGGVISFDPSNPEVTKDPTAIVAIGTQHSIVLGPDGNLWVATNDNLVKVPPAAPATAEAIPVAGLAPKDIDVAGANLVIADFGRILAYTTAGNQVGNFKVSGQAQGVAGNPDGQYAFTQPVNAPKEIGLLSPTASPVVLSAEGTDPFGIALGADGAYWSAEFISDGVTRMTADGQLSNLPGFAKTSGPRQISAGPGNTLWVILEQNKKVGRISGVEAEVAPGPPIPTVAPRTRIKAGPKRAVKTRKKAARVRFKFRSPDAGATFQCRLRQLAKKQKAKAAKRPKRARWGGCKSPRRYRLEPGRYRFEVRAVLAGAKDRTPAKRGFRVVRIGSKR